MTSGKPFYSLGLESPICKCTCPGTGTCDPSTHLGAESQSTNFPGTTWWAWTWGCGCVRLARHFPPCQVEVAVTLSPRHPRAQGFLF